jgi:hypothetical protein
MWLMHHTTISHASRTAVAPLEIFHIISLEEDNEQLKAG